MRGVGEVGVVQPPGQPPERRTNVQAMSPHEGDPAPLTPQALDELTDAEFVALTTYRRSGQPVPTPVWIARVGDALLISTPDGTGKLKRLRHTPRVTLQRCARRGEPVPGSTVWSATAQVCRDEATRSAAEGALRAKYGWQWRTISGIERLVRAVRRRPGIRPVVRVTA